MIDLFVCAFVLACSDDYQARCRVYRGTWDFPLWVQAEALRLYVYALNGNKFE